MYKIMFLIPVILFTGISIPQEAFGGELKLSIVYNNVPYDEDLACSWGMGCVVQGIPRTILFDTGGDGDILLSNMEKMGIEPDEIDLVVLSHIHGDHTGGLWKFLEQNSEVTVYIPASFSSSFQHRVEEAGAGVVRVKRPMEITPGVYSTGEVGTWIKEQALVIQSAKGLVVVTGCSHPGVDTIARRAAEYLEETIYLITGGFHLGGTSKAKIHNIIKDLNKLGVQKIAPSHCTGRKATSLFKQAWEKNFIQAGCGATISLPLPKRSVK
ncbi:MAG: MBL fold metallo-hydrolase [Spirochaetota bacterium]